MVESKIRRFDIEYYFKTLESTFSFVGNQVDVRENDVRKYVNAIEKAWADGQITDVEYRRFMGQYKAFQAERYTLLWLSLIHI